MATTGVERPARGPGSSTYHRVAVSRPVHAKQVRLALIPYRRADTAQPGGAHDLL